MSNAASKTEELVTHAERLTSCFNGWPSFHDAEVLRVMLDRTTPSATLVIHVWRTLQEVDDQGYYKRNTHTLVELCARDLLVCDLRGFNHQNVIFGLHIDRIDSPDLGPALRMELSTSYGLSCELVARQIEVLSIRSCNENGRESAA